MVCGGIRWYPREDTIVKKTIAKALRDHAELRGRINSLEDRLKKDFIKVEGRDPSYSDKEFGEMLNSLTNLRFEADVLKKAIDVANCVVVDGESVSLCLATRNRVSQELAFFTELRGLDGERFMYRDGVKFSKRVNDGVLDRTIDALTDQRRRLDDRICHLNATVEVVVPLTE